MSLAPAASRSTSSRWCRNSHSDSPLAETPAWVHSPEALCGAPDRVFDLLGGLRRIALVGDTYVHGTVVVLAQLRDEPGAQNRGLAEPRFAEQHREKLPLHSPGELGHFLVAAKEERASLFGERDEPQPRVARIDGRCERGRCRGASTLGVGSHARRAFVSSARRRANSGVTSPPWSAVACSA